MFVSGESAMNNWWYICWWWTCESSWWGKESREQSGSSGACLWRVVKYLANDGPNHKEKVREMGIWKLPGFKSCLMLTISAKELRAAPFLPAWPQGCGEGFGPAVQHWKALCSSPPVNKRSPRRWNPHLVHCPHTLFFSTRNSREATGCLASKKEKITLHDGSNLSLSHVLMSLTQWAWSRAPGWCGRVFGSKGLSSEAISPKGLRTSHV